VRLVDRFAPLEVIGVIESTTGARFVRDQLELAGWNVRARRRSEGVESSRRWCE
jgi:hypothetical protein